MPSNYKTPKAPFSPQEVSLNTRFLNSEQLTPPSCSPGSEMTAKATESFSSAIETPESWWRTNITSQFHQSRGCAYGISCFSRVWLFAILWTVACQASLSMGFSRQEYYSGLSCPPPRAGGGGKEVEKLPFPTQGLNPHLLQLQPCRQILYRWATREAQNRG